MYTLVFNYNPVNCCFGRVGDANGDGASEPSIADISVMIDAKFIVGTCNGVIGCIPEADINQSGGSSPSVTTSRSATFRR